MGTLRSLRGNVPFPSGERPESAVRLTGAPLCLSDFPFFSLSFVSLSGKKKELVAKNLELSKKMITFARH
jgi:hypothetical protein